MFGTSTRAISMLWAMGKSGNVSAFCGAVGEDRGVVSYLDRLARGRFLWGGSIAQSPDSREEINHAKILEMSALGRRNSKCRSWGGENLACSRSGQSSCRRVSRRGCGRTGSRRRIRGQILKGLDDLGKGSGSFQSIRRGRVRGRWSEDWEQKSDIICLKFWRDQSGWSKTCRVWYIVGEGRFTKSAGANSNSGKKL